MKQGQHPHFEINEFWDSFIELINLQECRGDSMGADLEISVNKRKNNAAGQK